ncbi:MAG: ABC transporter permease [Acidimicrobiales bacterium]|nr:ABC transporter permease [Acidimicrobiales bacterium]MCB9373160.1 ABC transporter permease [Microthrixaceae bacterium]
MATTTVDPAATAGTGPAAGPGAPVARHTAVADALTLTWRNLLNLRRKPQLIVFATIQPVIFVLMFRFVFGGAINVPGTSYVNYLMAGIFVQTVTFGALSTGVGLAEDMTNGLIDRFRSLPMARSAVLVGRTLADLCRNVFVVALMAVVGFLVGFRWETNALAFSAGLGVVLLFAFALSWMFAFVGMTVGDAETAQAASFPILAPLVFASSAFVPLDTMPGWLQAFAEHQPVSITVDAVRALLLGGPTAGPVLKALLWMVAIVAVFAPLAIARYRRV